MMGPRRQRLRQMAEAVRGNAPEIPLAEEALLMAAPEGEPEQLRDVAGRFRRCALGVGQVGMDLEEAWREKLPRVWGSEGALAGEKRLRTVAGRAEHSSEVLGRVDRCLRELAAYLEGAQQRDGTARDQIRTAMDLAADATGDVDLLESLRSWYAVCFEEMAAAIDDSEEAGAEAARQLRDYAGQARGRLLGPDLSPAPGTEVYDKSQQDLDSLSPELVEYAFTYAELLGVPVELLIALLMQEQPFYAGAPGPAQWAAGEAVEAAGRAGLGAGGDTSVGVAQMKPPTAQRLLEEAGYGTYEEDYLRNRLSGDDEFAVALAALHLKLDLDQGMTEKQAYLSYAYDPDSAADLTKPAMQPIEDYPELSARSDRYDENIRVINGAGDLREYFGI